MPCLPITEEVTAFEEALEILLPALYKEKLSDAAIRTIFSHPNIGMLDTYRSMAQFAGFTREMRERYPQFPQDGVIISCSFNLESGYDRFLLPDPNDRTTLGTVVYSWDKARRKKIRDSSLAEWFDLYISCAPEELLQELGIEKKVLEAKPLFRIQACPEPFKRMRMQFDGDAQDANPGWIPFTTIGIKGRFLVPCDLGQVPQSVDTPAIEVRPGTYRVDVRLARSRKGNGAVIAAVRVVQDGAPELSLIRKFDLDVDLAAISIFDRQPFFKRVPLDDREDFGSDLMMDDSEKPYVAVAGKTEVLVIPSGHGDGTYPVYQLASDGVSFGMEIHFLDDANAAQLVKLTQPSL